MSRGRYDAVIAGGGIVGAACALEFAECGLRVALIEPSLIGGGATAAGMGHLAVMDDSEAQFALTRYSQQLWQERAPSLPADIEYRQCGSLWVAADESEMEEVRRKYGFYTARKLDVQILDEHELREVEPHLRHGLSGALLMSEDSVIYPPCAARYFARELQRHGGEVLLGQRVVAVEEQSVTLSDGTKLSADAVVLANGIAARELVPEVKLAPRKGHLVITDRHPGFVTHQLIELGYLKSAHTVESNSVAFNIQPRCNGQLLIGSSRQFGTEETRVESTVLSAMLARAVAYMPELRNLSAIRSWTGFRAATPDKLPLIGPCPGYRSIYLAAGHEGLGISTSLATAKLLGDFLLSRNSTIPKEPYLPERQYAVHA